MSEPIDEKKSKEVEPEKSQSNVASVRPQPQSSSSSSHHNESGPMIGRSPSPVPCSSRSLGRIHKNEKFVPNAELVKTIMDMGICRNGAVKALYWTGNQSALAASNWIFDQPERDLDTPLEDELEMIRAQQAEREREDLDERAHTHICNHHHHFHHHHDIDEDDIDEEDLMMEEEEEEDEDLEDEEEEEDYEDDEDEIEYKMVFVVNKSLEMKAGVMSLHVGKATAGLCKKINSQPQSSLIGPDELSSWGDMGEKMVVLSAENEQHMKDLELMAKNLRLPSQMRDIYVEGGMRKGVLGIFGEEREVNKVTGRLKVVN